MSSQQTTDVDAHKARPPASRVCLPSASRPEPRLIRMQTARNDERPSETDRNARERGKKLQERACLRGTSCDPSTDAISTPFRTPTPSPTKRSCLIRPPRLENHHPARKLGRCSRPDKGIRLDGIRKVSLLAQSPAPFPETFLIYCIIAQERQLMECLRTRKISFSVSLAQARPSL